ncbi:MAG TPA: hypothetical protein PLA50_15340 [Bacteroidia bacterium]|nr:hypothetical protein [Bacteroidia bacterium]
MPSTLKTILEFVTPFFRRRAGYALARLLVAGGIGILSNPWWIPFLEAVFDKKFGIPISTTASIVVGLILVVAGVAIYFFEHQSEPPPAVPETSAQLSVKAHFGYWRAEPNRERIFVKITNESSTKPATVTHIDYDGRITRAILSTPLPQTIPPSQQFEIHMPVEETTEQRGDHLLNCFVVTDSSGRKIRSEKNLAVSEQGYIAQLRQ